MKKFNTIVFFFIIVSGFSQKVKSVYPDFSNKTLKEVLNNNQWRIFSKAEGFLNSDNIKDLAIILESKDSIIETRVNKPRKNIAKILLVFINDKVIVQNNTFIPREDEGGMNYVVPTLVIKEQKLNIYIEYLRAYVSYFFKFKKRDIYLTSAKTFSRHSATGNFESEFFDFKKKILYLITGNVSKDKEIKKEIPFELKSGFKKLSELKKMYDWEVLKYHSL